MTPPETPSTTQGAPNNPGSSTAEMPWITPEGSRLSPSAQDHSMVRSGPFQRGPGSPQGLPGLPGPPQGLPGPSQALPGPFWGVASREGRGIQQGIHRESNGNSESKTGIQHKRRVESVGFFHTFPYAIRPRVALL